MTWNSEKYKGRWQELDNFYQLSLNKNKNMNGILTLSWTNCKSALVYGLLSAILAMSLYAISIGDVFKLDLHALINSGVFGLLAVLVSLIKNLLTTNQGNFLGTTKVVDTTTQ